MTGVGVVGIDDGRDDGEGSGGEDVDACISSIAVFLLSGVWLPLTVLIYINPSGLLLTGDCTKKLQVAFFVEYSGKCCHCGFLAGYFKKKISGSRFSSSLITKFNTHPSIKNNSNRAWYFAKPPVSLLYNFTKPRTKIKRAEPLNTLNRAERNQRHGSKTM